MATEKDMKILERIKAHPGLKERFEAILDIAENKSGELITADQLEHYRIELPVSSIQAIVENHAKNIFDFVETEEFEEGTVKQIVAEMDGSMIPEEQTVTGIGIGTITKQLNPLHLIAPFKNLRIFEVYKNLLIANPTDFPFLQYSLKASKTTSMPIFCRNLRQSANVFSML